MESVKDLTRRLEASAAAYDRPACDRISDEICAALYRHESGYPVEAAARMKTVLDYDEEVVARQFGFAGAEDYYRKQSALPLLASIQTPALIIHAQNDPMVPMPAHRKAMEMSSGAVNWLCPKDGGHVGFWGRRVAGEDRYWAENRALDFIARYD